MASVNAIKSGWKAEYKKEMAAKRAKAEALKHDAGEVIDNNDNQMDEPSSSDDKVTHYTMEDNSSDSEAEF